MPNPSPGFVKNPAKVLTIVPQMGTVIVTAGGKVIAQSSDAKLLSEPPYPDRIYVPFKDIRFDELSKTTHSTHCPYKGDASYWTVPGDTGTNAMWAYQTPYDEVTEIKDHASSIRTGPG
ncbi:MAG TPA: DUF427 domain-containing protein [Rhizobiaceae bacterium]|nr:DUF427 domain-containing protein [Rhizobiaceae bacterium]